MTIHNWLIVETATRKIKGSGRNYDTENPPALGVPDDHQLVLLPNRRENYDHETQQVNETFDGVESKPAADLLDLRRQYYIDRLTEYYNGFVYDSRPQEAAPMLVGLALARGHASLPAGLQGRIDNYTAYYIRVTKGFLNYLGQLQTAADEAELQSVAVAAKAAISATTPPAETIREIFVDIPTP